MSHLSNAAFAQVWLRPGLASAQVDSGQLTLFTRRAQVRLILLEIVNF